MNKTTLVLAASMALFTGVAAAQPVVSSATNAASYAPAELPGSGIARGSMFVIFGQRLGPATLNLINNFPLPTVLDGTSAKVTVSGTTVDALMIYTSAAQVAAILPSSTPEGNGTLTVSYSGQTSAPFNIRVVRSAFGAFAVNQAGSGPAIVQNFVSQASQPVNALNRPARAGQTVILWGTGLGPVTRDERAGEASGDLPINVEVYVGGKRANVTYKGRSGCCAGIDQIVFAVPEGVEGCYVPVVVKIDNAVSNFTSMAVGSGNACSDVSGLSSTDIERAQASGIFRVGGISLIRTESKFAVPGVGSFDMKNDAGAAYFIRYDLNRLLQSQGTQGNYGSTSLGACTVYSIRGQGSGSSVDPIRPEILDAGNAITVEGPRGTKQLTKDANSGGFYSAVLGGGGINIPGIPQQGQPDYLEPGSYRITGPGGANVGAFTANITLPAALTWTNIDATNTIVRSAGQTVNWTGGDPSGYVAITGFSFNNNVTGGFYCLERISARTFNIPSYVLLSLPPSSGQVGGALSLSGTTSVNITPPPSGLDAAAVTVSSGSSKTVTFQ